MLPIPFAKTLVYPLDGERYTKAWLSSFFLKSTNRLLAPVELGVEVDHINMASDDYNTISGQLDPQETMLLNENVQKQRLPRKKSSLVYRKSSTTHRQSIEEEPLPQDYSAAPFEFSLQKLQTLVE